jgi:hypothetical protein
VECKRRARLSWAYGLELWGNLRGKGWGGIGQGEPCFQPHRKRYVRAAGRTYPSFEEVMLQSDVGSLRRLPELSRNAIPQLL